MARRGRGKKGRECDESGVKGKEAKGKEFEDAYLEGVEEAEPMPDLMDRGLALVVAVDWIGDGGHAT